MIFIELPTFTKRVGHYLTDEEYRVLQQHLISHPDSGAVIPKAKGLRKMRWTSLGKGKRSGVRIIYYWITRDNQIVMFTIYKKSEQDDLTHDQLSLLLEYLEP